MVSSHCHGYHSYQSHYHLLWDYCNSLLNCLPAFHLALPWTILNVAVRVILLRRSQIMTPLFIASIFFPSCSEQNLKGFTVVVCKTQASQPLVLCPLRLPLLLQPSLAPFCHIGSFSVPQTCLTCFCLWEFPMIVPLSGMDFLPPNHLPYLLRSSLQCHQLSDVSSNCLN